MKSLLVEFHRFNDLETGALRKGDPYLIAAAAHPVREFKMPLDQVDLLDHMLGLRYQAGAEARRAALQEIGEAVTSILGAGNLQELEDGDLQLDLVVNAAELAALPFEMVSDRAGDPLLVRDEKPVELTRRVRHDFAETAVRWPAKPRILFAWACPSGAGVDVPYREHEEALRAALKPWMPLQQGAVADALTVLEQAGVASLQKACADSVAAQKPFTHVHILAHGYPVGRGHRQRFGMALHDEDNELQAVPPEALTEALAPLCGQTVVVTMATCDAANLTNTLAPEKSIAHQLHVSGFPVVIASQLPLTVAGSNLMVETFYKALLAGRDVRSALHEARTVLYKNRDRTGHDWGSLVGYVRLPEGYADHLKDVRLQAVLSSLEIAQAWSDSLVASGCADPVQFDNVASHLQGCIKGLDNFLSDPAESRKGIHQENLGLLGSAEKRLAELHFTCGQRIPSEERRQKMQDALQRSRLWYKQGYEHNLSHHWTGVQYLSLESVLEGKISNPGPWYAAMAAAEIDGKKPNDYWARGSLAELDRLAPLAGQPRSTDAAIAILEDMKICVRDHAGGDCFPLESTVRQFRRYRDWWTTGNGFFPGGSDLAAEAAILLEVLQR